jgi:hypothetical protein
MRVARGALRLVGFSIAPPPRAPRLPRDPPAGGPVPRAALGHRAEAWGAGALACAHGRGRFKFSVGAARPRNVVYRGATNGGPRLRTFGLVRGLGGHEDVCYTRPMETQEARPTGVALRSPLMWGRTARRVGGLLLLAIALLAANCLYLNYLSQRYQLFAVTDFSHHGWLAARVLLGGGSPYDSQTWLLAHWTPEYERDVGLDFARGQFVNSFYTRPGMVYNPQHLSDFLYPVWVAFLLRPFALLPLYWALALFMLANELAFLLAGWLACRLLRFHPPWPLALLLALLALGYRPTFFTLQEGAYTGMVLAALLGAVLLIQQRRWPWLVCSWSARRCSRSRGCGGATLLPLAGTRFRSPSYSRFPWPTMRGITTSSCCCFLGWLVGCGRR